MVTARSVNRRGRTEGSEDEAESSRRASIKKVKLERRQTRSPSPADDEAMEHGQNGYRERSNITGDESEHQGRSIDDEEEDNYEGEEDDGGSRAARSAFPDDIANVEAYERLASRDKRKKRYGKPSDAGAIKSISVIDFMNHRHTTVDFSPKMNFLVGHNGSGKSAILTAIAVVFGGKASSTGRGNGLKDLIRKGCDKATIIMTMNNSGHEAFKPDLYDPEIIIERTLNINGSSTYKFRASRDGKTIANRRDELQQIVEHFNITIDSPLTILTQDAARTFLQNANDVSLYSFFLEGTGLKTLMTQYERLAINQQSLDNIVASSKEALAVKKAKVDDLARKIKQSAKIESLIAQSKRLRQELAWAYVIEKEQACTAAQEDFNVMQEKVDKVRATIEEKMVAFKPIDESSRLLEREFTDFEKSRQRIQADKRKAELKLRTARASLQEQMDTHQDMVDSISKLNEKLAGIRRRIAELEAAQTETQDPRQVSLRQDIEKHEVLLTKLTRELPTREATAKRKEEERDRIEQEIGDLEQQRDAQEAEMSRAKNTIKNLETQVSNRLSAFGTNIEAVLQEIDAARWRHSKPLGPLGRYVHLNDFQYKDIISAHLGPLLCGFAVRCKEDRAQMMSILSRCSEHKGYRPGTAKGGMPPVIQHTGDLFNFASGDMSNHGDTMLSKLRIDDEEVLRILVVQRNIERIFVAKDVQVANRMLDDFLNRGISPVVIHSADKYNVGGSHNSRGTSTLGDWRGNPLFLKDVQREIQHHQRILETATGLKAKFMSQLTELTASRNLAQADVAAAIRKIGEIRRAIPQTNQKIESLRGQLQDSEKENDQDAFEEMRRSTENDLVRMEEERDAANRSLPEFRENVAKLEKEVRRYDQRLETFGDELEAKREAHAQMLSNREGAEREIAHYKKSEERYAAQLTNSASELERVRDAVVNWTEQAEKIAPRIETTESPKRIAEKRASIAETIEAAKKRGAVVNDDLHPAHAAAEKGYNEDRKKVEQLEIFCKLLARAIRERQLWWGDVRNHIAVRARVLFIVHCQKRGLEGRLEFVHEKEKLLIMISSGTQRRNDNGESTQPGWKVPRNLSGGERSFSTVALLLAMWDVATSPVRCLDEWDVFLDSVNRGIAAKLLIEGALASDQKQFILITPQDMSGIKIGPEIKVNRLSDPERGQATLNFAPQ